MDTNTKYANLKKSLFFGISFFIDAKDLILQTLGLIHLSRVHTDLCVKSVHKQIPRVHTDLCVNLFTKKL